MSDSLDYGIVEGKGKKIPKDMRRGRAPCCDKNTVVKGPWSPAEDLKLISYIQKHGHENWRALPKQAGLLRCGKSCRLRWINYLRPDLKRGNFTAEEERIIMQLHQSFGNKWSRIAAHLPGRTDNEIKNHWNTHLKKRLSNKAAKSKQDETSLITFSSSSSTLVESGAINDKTETDSQINLLPLDGSTAQTFQMESSKTIIASNKVSQLQDFDTFNKSGSSSYQQSDELLDSNVIDQIEQFPLWEDPNELDFLLSEFEDPDLVITPQKNQVDATEINSSCELPVDSVSEIWSILNNNVIPASANPVDNIHTLDVPLSQKSINAANEWITDKNIDDTFEYLNNEPGQAQISIKMQNQGGDLNHNSPATATVNEDNGMPNMDDI